MEIGTHHYGRQSAARQHLHTNRAKRDFLRAVLEGRVTEHAGDMARLHHTPGGLTDDAKPLLDWAADHKLVKGWTSQHSRDWHFVSLSEAGQLALANLDKAINGN